MGKIIPTFKKAVIDEITASITANTARYYAFAANPVVNANGVPDTDYTDYDTFHNNNWQAIFGKRITDSDILAVVDNNTWTANTVYARYNDKEDMTDEEFFVTVPPALPGGYYHVYKCIDNANGANSTVSPDLQQGSSFTKSDGYTWRYMFSVSSANYSKFATTDYIPVTPNTTIVTNARNYQGVEVVSITNNGNGYSSYHDGTITSVVNSSLIEISSNASTDTGFYTNNGIYIYNDLSATGQLRLVSSYVSNLSGKWVYLDSTVNTAAITAGTTNYKISPAVVFNTDGTDPLAYSVMNTTSNTISSITVIDVGSNITRADVVLQSNSIYGSGANAYAILPPPGGHGSDPAAELNCQGVCIAFNFANTESSTIPTNISYNKIGLYKNPSIRLANTDKGGAFVNATFSQVLKANVYPSATFSNGDFVYGSTSGAKGLVAFSNSTQLYLCGDNLFSNGETITSANGSLSTVITINSFGHLYMKDLKPLYTQNISDATRGASQTESFKIVLQV